MLSGPNSQDTFRRATRELAAFAAVKSPYLVTLYDAGQQRDDLSTPWSTSPTDRSPTPQERWPPAGSSRRWPTRRGPRTRCTRRASCTTTSSPATSCCRTVTRSSATWASSQLLTPGLTITGIGSTGSVEYLDPAIIRGEIPGRATDIFALGATLHRALTGAGLYGDLPTDSTMLAMRRVLSREPEISPDLPAGVSEIIASAIDPDNAQRPVTAESLAASIDALPAGAAR